MLDEDRNFVAELEKQIAGDVHHIETRLRSIPVTPGSSNTLRELDLCQAVEAVHEMQESTIKRWIDFESDPEIIAACEITQIDKVSGEFDKQALEPSHSDEQPSQDFSEGADDPRGSNYEQPESLSESVIKQNLLTYAMAAIDSKISDPILLDLSQKLKAHLENCSSFG